MKIVLPPHLEEVVRQKVRSGEYFDESEVVGEALELLIAHDRWPELKLLRLQTALKEGSESGIAEDFSFEKLNAELDCKKAAPRRRRA
jgi:putative addiction module CopG family antidote